jgi:hypothetical protein
VLYAASNLGSMLALVSYPLLLEPRLPLAGQSRLWSAGYLLFGALIAACAAWTWRRSPGEERRPQPAADRSTPEGSGGPAGRGTAGERGADAARDGICAARALRWTALAFVPSSLLLGVTTYFTTDIAAIPLFWVVPLVVYLATFVIAFSGRLRGLRDEIRVWLPVLVLWLSFSMLIRLSPEIWVGIPLHLGTFFLAALLCHGELASSRPPPRHLTAFYYHPAGPIGQVFTSLVRPRPRDRVALVGLGRERPPRAGSSWRGGRKTWGRWRAIDAGGRSRSGPAWSGPTTSRTRCGC